MEFKFDQASFGVFDKSNVIPPHLQWILQPGYTPTFIHGEFGKFLLQQKTEGVYDLRIHYVEVWKPVEFYVIVPKRILTIYLSYAHDVQMHFNNGQFRMYIGEGSHKVLGIPEYPAKHAIPMNEQGFYISWHLTAPKEHEQFWRDANYVEKLSDKYRPNIDFKKAGAFKLCVPLAK